MKKLLCAILSAVMLAGCSAPAVQTAPPESASTDSTATHWQLEKGGLEILAPNGMAENAITTEKTKDHTVIRISAPGTYVLSGKLTPGQIAVDLGEQAKDDPNAVVTLILDGLDITCPSAPAIIFYNVYESSEPGGPDGANVILAEGSRNDVNGSHTEEYDGALYSRMSMTLDGGGSLSITADNEGLCSEMHLTVNGGEITIESGNDGINTNADGVSVTTINGGSLNIRVTGETGEGDGIDSNGALVINGGTIHTFACGSSGDGGIDADKGIRINGGTLCATGNMIDRIDENSQTHAVFTFADPQKPGIYTLKNAAGETVMELNAENTFRNLILSAPDLTEGTYTLWAGDTQFEGMVGAGGGFFGELQPIEGPDWPGRDEGRVEIPPQPTQPIVTHGVQPTPDMSVQGEGPAIGEMPDGERPTDMPIPDFGGFDPSQMPVPPMPQEGADLPATQLPEGVEPPRDGFGRHPIGDTVIVGILSTDFHLKPGANYFTSLRPVA